MTKEYDEISGTIAEVTDKAILVDIKGTRGEHWIPRSVIEDGDEINENDIGEDLEFMVESWFVDKEGL